jgi:glutaminyl-peptide cyclotransferase
MTLSSVQPPVLPVLAEGQAPHVTRARVYGQTDAPVETYRILETLPHDVNDYTEGLFIHDGYLYEATGEYGK